MRSHLGRRSPDPALLVGTAVVVLLVLGVVLVLTRGDAAPAEDEIGLGLGSTIPDLSEATTPPAPRATPTVGSTGVTPPSAQPVPGPAPEVSAADAAAPPASVDPVAPADPAAPAAPAAPAPPAAAAPAPPAPAGAAAPTTLEPGTCFDGPAEAVSDVQPRGCAEPHGNEVYVVATTPGDPSAPYPGEERLLEETGALCRGQAFDDYVGVPWANSRFFTAPLVPTEATWAAGDRAIACFLYDLNGPREGSARGARM